MWRLGSSYDVTKYITEMAEAEKIIGVVNEDGCLYRHGYFVCHDALDIHIYRIQVGINSMYEKEPATKIIEQFDILNETLRDYCVENYSEELIKTNIGRALINAKEKQIRQREYVDILRNALGIEKLLKIIVELDAEMGFENTDITEFRYDTPLEHLVQKVDGGFGITKIELPLD